MRLRYYVIKYDDTYIHLSPGDDGVFWAYISKDSHLLTFTLQEAAESVIAKKNSLGWINAEDESSIKKAKVKKWVVDIQESDV